MLALAVLIALFALFEAGLAAVFRQPIFDTYQRLMPRPVEGHPAIIIDIDDRSLAALGQWPWPRTLTARLVEAVAALEPRVIGFDIIMPEPDRLSPGRIAASHPDIDIGLQKSLSELESNDSLLAKTIARVPVVLARAGLRDPGAKPIAVPQTPVMIEGDGDLSGLLGFDKMLLNVPELEAAALGFGLLNTTRDPDGVVRRVPLIMRYGSKLMPSLALELLRLAVGANWLTVETDARGVSAIGIGKPLVETDPDGQLTVYFSTADPRRRISALDVLNGVANVTSLQGKVALIGVTGLGLTNVVSTPVSARMDGVEVHAQVIENIVTGHRLVRTRHALGVELSVALVLGGVVIWLLPRLSTVAGSVLVLGALAIGFALSFWAFVAWRELYDPVPLVVTTVTSYFLLLSVMLSEANRQHRLLNETLENERLQAARMAGELSAAREIQLGMLPDPGHIEGLPGSVRLAALLEPAREVGGDLYDFYMLDSRRLFFMVGDVAGKGVPASLFMAISKVLCKQVATRELSAVGDITSKLNEALSRENPSELFVTAVAVMLDVQTGEGQLCIAGHDAPLVVNPGGRARSVDSPGGPPLCTLDEFDYPTESFRLQPGEVMVLWTDGVGESIREETAITGTATVESSFYGRQGVIRFLQQLEAGTTAHDLVTRLYADVNAFCTDPENGDDITIVAVQYLGAQRCQQRKN